MTSVLVVGAGWLGSAIAHASAARGASVWSMRRSAAAGDATEHASASSDRAERGGVGSHVVHSVQGDIMAANDDAGLDALLASLSAMHVGAPSDAVPGPVHVVLCVAPSRSRGDSYGNLYPAAARGAARLAVALGARTLVYTSSTGVYGVTDGSWVTELREIHPRDERVRALFDAEQAVLHHASDASRRHVPRTPGDSGRTGRIVLRVAGLYGPQRDPGPRFSPGVPLEGDGLVWCNFAWRDDVVSAVALVQENAVFHQGQHVFNCADGHPVLGRDIAGSLGAAPGAEDGFARTPGRQRIAVDRLRDAGWTPRVPDVYTGLELLGHRVSRPQSAGASRRDEG